MKIVGYQICLRITRFVILVIRPDYQKFCLRLTPGSINSYQHSFFPSIEPIAIRHSGGCFAHSIQERTCLLGAALNHIMDHVLSAPHHALFLPFFTNVLYFYMNFISAHLLLIFYSWSKHKRICTVRQYSGSLAHPRGMYYNGKEGKEQCINRIQFTSLVFSGL